MNKNKIAIYFVHIQKTAGTSLSAILKNDQSTPPCLRIGGFKQYFLNSFSDSDKYDNAILGFHYYYGLHQANWKHLLGINKHTYITLLRDPIERAISYYYYVKRQRPKKYEHPSYKSAIKLDLKDFYQTGYNHVYQTGYDNVQTKMLSGIQSKNVQKCNQQMLEKAQKNLANSFAVCGITERFKETVELLNFTFNWQIDTSNLLSKKVNKQRPKSTDLSTETLASLKESHQFDLQLYDFAVQLFEKQLEQIKF